MNEGQMGVDDTTEPSNKELFNAIDVCDVGRVITLLAEGADPNERDPFSWQRPLHVAAKRGSIEIVQRLLDDGRVDIDAADCCSRFPLDIASRMGHDEIVKLLKERAMSQPEKYEEYLKLLQSRPDPRSPSLPSRQDQVA